jgi:hypothetical protein
MIIGLIFVLTTESPKFENEQMISLLVFQLNIFLSSCARLYILLMLCRFFSYAFLSIRNLQMDGHLKSRDEFFLCIPFNS